MARAVAEIHSPGQARVIAVGVIGEAGEEATDAADRHCQGQGVDPQVAGTMADAGGALGDFHADPSADEAADNRLSAEPFFQSDAACADRRHGCYFPIVFRERQQACPCECPDNCAGDFPEASLHAFAIAQAGFALHP